MAIIRDANEKDLESINDILRINGQIDDVNKEDLREFIVAVADGKVVGCGMLKEHEGSVEISKVSVLPENQGRGLGMEIVLTLLGRAKEKRCWLLSVDSHSFWENFGFHIVPEDEEPVEIREQCEKCQRSDECNRVVMIKNEQ
jgi:N-acetylglutamate synthase-like GNAT family acetyltransferase